MTTKTMPGIDFSTFPSSDGLPMAETHTNASQMIDLMFALRHLLAPIENVYVGGNQLMYYNPQDGWDHISPDVYVATGVAPGLRESWKVWEEGKFPDIIFEIVSPSTQGRDLGAKRALYAQLGAIEYYIFDPMGHLPRVFQPFHRAGDLLAPAPQAPDGSVSSTLLPFTLRVVGTRLRVFDSSTGQLCPTPDEEREARLAAEKRAASAEQALRDALARMAERSNDGDAQ